MQDGSVVLQSGSGESASKIVLHPTEGILISAPNISAMADDYYNVGAGSYHVTSLGEALVAAGGNTELWGDTVIAKNFVRGELLAERSTTPTDLTLELYSNDGTGWTLEKSFSVSNTGSYTIDPATEGIELSGKVFKVRLVFDDEVDADGDPVEEYIESEIFGGGSGPAASGIVFRVNGGDPDYEACIPTGEVITKLHYSGLDENDNLIIDITTGCLQVEIVS